MTSEIVFADSETRSLLDVTQVGAYKYAYHHSTEILIWSWAFDDEPTDLWSPAWAWGNAKGTRPDLHPDRLLDHVNEGGYFVAWNAFFDRHIWNAVMVKKYGWPPLKLEQVLCAQAQAEGNNLPGRLEKAAEALGTPHRKDPKGKQLIAQLSAGDKASWDSELFETPSKMGHFRSYADSDVTTMRDIWQCTRPLTLPEWAEYHASEAINDRGVAVDVEFARAAQQYARAESEDVNERMAELTGDDRITITNHPRKARYAHDELWPDEELQQLTEKPPKKVGDPPRLSCDKSVRAALLDLLVQPEHAERFAGDHADRIVSFLELVEAGNSAAVRKFTAIVNQEFGGRVRGGYSFNGAGQTGRFSSRGIQVHNLIRDPVAKGQPNRAIDAVEAIIGGASTETLQNEFGFSISRLLARLIRPTFIADEGKTLVWADWDQIEARVLPWLANSPGAEAKLDLFRAKKDVYKYAAMPIFGKDNPDDITDSERQVGKVSELALGFGGSVGAFSAMGRNYGLTLPENQVKPIVEAWRRTNGWCVSFWHQLWEAAINAYKAPGNWFTAGRVRYLFHPQLMRGSLICELPDKRWLVYPQFKHERVIVDDDEGRPVTRMRTSFMKGFGGGAARVDLWYGILAENITQGTAASFLRMAIYDLQDYLVLHTHDEVVGEIEEDQADWLAEAMDDSLTYLPDWADGLPLSVTVESGPFYTK